MTGCPYADETEATYENFDAVCPVCQARNVFNRASDLETFEPIAFRTVRCQSPQCAAHFNIGNDRINPAHQAVLFDCYEIVKAKRYMQAVLSITQAYEMLFSHSLRVEVLFRPYVRDQSDDHRRLNELERRLYQSVETFTFEPMRRLFLSLAVRPEGFSTLDQSEAWVGCIPSSSRGVVTVPVDHIEAVSDATLRALLAELAGVTVHRLRNSVIHKSGYRPKREEVDAAFTEAKRLIHGLTSALKLGGDAGWYLNAPGR